MSSPSLLLPFLLLLLVILTSPLVSSHSPSCGFSHADGSDHHNDHSHGGNEIHHPHSYKKKLLPEELAEEEDLAVDGFHHHHYHEHNLEHNHEKELSAAGLWVKAMGCSLLVSLASLICLILLPVICFKGKPSKTLVDSLALFGAGAMLGDAFLHQLPHAFGGQSSHSHEHLTSNIDDDHHGHGHSHSHSLQDLSIGLSILSGIVIFLLVEKIVRYVEEHTENEGHRIGHSHHHSHSRKQKVKNDDDNLDSTSALIDRDTLDTTAGEKKLDSELTNLNNDKNEMSLRKRATLGNSTIGNKKDSKAMNGLSNEKEISSEPSSSHEPSSLIFGYLNLFSDGVHNFTDGMALGSAFLLHGSVGGWSRTLFLLAHELPQEIGDFGILVRSGFTVSKALFFNFLSALVALAGTALALVLGKDPGQSSLIEGFTAGGFIYIAAAGVLPEMNKERTTLRSTVIQVTSLTLGMAVALLISLVE